MLSAALLFGPRALIFVEGEDIESACALVRIHHLVCCFRPRLVSGSFFFSAGQ